MSLFKILDISGSALSAESVRLNLIASNLANAESTSNSPEQTYRSRQPVFAEILGDEKSGQASGVKLVEVVESMAPLRLEYRPGHPDADSEGYVTLPNVNVIEEMVNMVSATRSYQSNIEVINNAKQMLLQTLSLGK
jgi:flagellar basal-body rod protein FlgC